MYEPTAEDKKLYSKMSLSILSPIMHAEPNWVRSMANMISYSWMHGLKIYAMGCTERTVVDWARNSLANDGLHKKCEYTGKHYTHFLWLDSDHVFNPDMACYLARSFKDKRVDAVSALYYGRDDQPLPVAYVKDETEDEFKHYPIVIVPPALFEVDAFGFGACITKRDMFVNIPKPWFTVDWRAGEDIAFCVKAKKLGYRFFVDGTYRMGHIGTAPIITEQTYREHMEKNPEKYADKIRIGDERLQREERKHGT
jgi:hypothetical protein